MNIHHFWRDVLAQTAEAIPQYFTDDAVIRWHCTNEQFTVAEFVRANCEYPGNWSGAVERVAETADGLVTATHVYTTDGALYFHVTSFVTLRDGKIAALDEYWADDGDAPQWRRDMQIGKPIK